MSILKTKILSCCSLIVLTFLLNNPTSVWADQNDVRLETLFEQLKTSDRSNQTIESLIWAIWIETTDPELNAAMQHGINAMSTFDLPAALKSFNSIVENAPQYAEGWNKRATLYYLMGQFDQSMLDVQKVLQLEPRHFGALSGMGLIFMQSGNDIRALQAFQTAAGINPHMTNINEFIKILKENIAKNSI